jgi:hypothetical protein
VNHFDFGDLETSSFTFEALVSLRRMHQRKQAEPWAQLRGGYRTPEVTTTVSQACQGTTGSVASQLQSGEAFVGNQDGNQRRV